MTAARPGQGRYDEARGLHEASLAISAELGDHGAVAESENYLGFAAWLEGDFGQAGRHCARALEFFEAAGRRHESASALINLGTAAHYAGDDQLAVDRLRRALAISREIGYLEGMAWALHALG